MATTTSSAMVRVLILNNSKCFFTFLFSWPLGCRRKSSFSKLLLKTPKVLYKTLMLISPSSDAGIRYRICGPGFAKGTQPQQAALADAAGHGFAGITRPTY